MKDLGIKERTTGDAMYPTMTDKSGEAPKVRYDKISLTMKICGDKKYSMGDEVEVTVRGKVTGLEQNTWNPDGTITIEAHKGECESYADEKAEKTLLGEE